MFNIISWNVNGIRAVEKKSFIPWLLDTNADVVCIQETKANPSQLSEELLSQHLFMSPPSPLVKISDRSPVEGGQ